jgi:formamidopyrimidine-DNA glycosylase
MPELAEVEANRRLWECCCGETVRRVELHERVRVFRSIKARAIRSLVGSKLLGSEARGKLMLFRFSRNRWLSIHLGMSGRLRVESADFKPARHDHLALFQSKRTLVFTDPRQFGAVRFHIGKEAPDWWQALPPAVLSKQFTLEAMRDFLQRHARLPIKGTLLLQSGFPGVGNWMADEILWQARINPKRPTGRVTPELLERLWRKTRVVCSVAVRSIVEAYCEPPARWLFHERWSASGKCPRDGTELKRDTVAGRTSAWCPKCQGT